MISLIICTYNRDQFIYQTLEHIAANQFLEDQYEIVLINNNSTDHTESECQRFCQNFPQVPMRYFIEMKQGLSHARNRGIEEAKGDILVFLDDDSFVREDYLRNLAENIIKYPDMMAFGGEIEPLFETGRTPDWLCSWTYSWVSAINKGDKVCLFKGKSYPIGANMGFRKECIQQCGEFNTELGRTGKNMLAGEEKDLFNAIKELGMKIYYFPNLFVQHVIPEKRTTDAYIKRLGYGIGISEYLRTRKKSSFLYFKRLFSEMVKWAATIVLWVKYTFSLQFSKGNKLVLFRWNVTKGLLKLKSDN